MRITNVGQMVSGEHVNLVIGASEFHGVLFKAPDGAWYVLHNDSRFDGSGSRYTNERFRYSWMVHSGTNFFNDHDYILMEEDSVPLEDGKTRCSLCNKIIDIEEAKKDPYGNFVCDSCFGEKYVVCCQCDEIVPTEESTWHDGNSYCESCFDRYLFRCEDCGGIFYMSEGHLNNRGESVCDSCYDENYTSCENCGCTIRQVDALEENGRNVCSECYSGEEEAGGLLDYGATRARVFLRDGESDIDAKDGIFLGVELEVDDGKNLTDTVDELGSLLGGNADLKKDGSLSNGFEIATQPATLRYHKGSYGWEKIISILQDHEWKSHQTTTCGLHIHVSRKYFDPMDLIKLALFWYAHQEEIRKISRRDPGHYCKWKDDKGIKRRCAYNGNPSQAVRDHSFCSDRYESVNFTESATVEFRSFRGTIKKETLYATMEFVHALCRWIKTVNVHTVLLQKESWESLKKYIDGNKEYNNLKTYLNERIG